MATYTAKQGDTFELVSRKMFGTANETGKIRSSNPSLSEPFTAGSVLFIPSPAKLNTVTANEDVVTVLIDRKEFKYFSNVEFFMSFDSFDSVSITAPFDPDNKEFRETFIPFSYASVDLYIGNTLMFSGTQMGLTPQISPDSKVVILEAYAKCAVINDSNMPISSYPIELRGLKLDRIAAEVCKPFPFTVTKDTDIGATFETVAIKHSDKIYSFLVQLCKQRDLILSNDSNGDLLITKAVNSTSVASLRDDSSPVISVSPTHNDQEYFSDYTAVMPVIIGLPVASYTAKNKRLSNILRVNNFTANDAKNGDEKTVAESRRSRGLANSISYQVELATIRDSSGDLFKPNTYVDLYAPTAMIYTETTFFIRSVDTILEGDKKTCRLDLVLPESYNGNEVGSFPWEE